MKEHIEKYSTADQYPDPTQTSYIPPVTNDSDSIFHCPTNQLESFPIGETPDYPDFGLKHIIADVLNALPPHHRNLLALRFGLDEQIPMSWGQIAEKMGISEKTAKNTMGYIKRKIKRYYPYLRQYQ